MDIVNFYKQNTVDKSFNHIAYQQHNPKTNDFYQPYCKDHNIDEQHRLYFHYKMHNTENFLFFTGGLQNKEKNNVLYIKPTNGLANRLLFINSCFNFVDRFGFNDLKIFWTRSKGFSDIEFSKIFDISFLDKRISFIEEKEYLDASNKLIKLEDIIVQDKSTLDYHIKDYHVLEYISSHSFTFSSWMCFEYFYPNIFPYKLNFIRSLRPSKNLKSKIDSCKIPKNCIGVHLRRGDSKYATYAFRYQNSMVSSYINLINNEIESDNIFLSTDCEESQRKIIHSCPTKNIHVINKPFVDRSLKPNDNKDHQLYAAIDLFCLSNCKKIYGNENSTFGRTAAELSNTEFSPVDIKNLYHYNNFSLPPLTLTVGIKNRFQQLKVALNSWIIQDAIKEILIVDWDSEDIDHRYLKKLDKRIKVLRINNQPNYEHARVLNTCIDNAKYDHIIKMDVDYIINPYYRLEQWLDIDWDIQFMSGYWGQKILDNELGFIEHLNGFMCIHRDHVNTIGGYNKNFIGYGWEDCELYIRLVNNLGLEKLSVPISSNFVPIYHMPHDDHIRTKYQKEKDREVSRMNNASRTEYKSYNI